ncbi:MAG: UDP-N-acetylglucosamine--N-acetylmuramyl-(pentapeptide) pyrophosphoryl-undecaprenol N-acetylglucosamine transferase [Leptospirales bacterium]
MIYPKTLWVAAGGTGGHISPAVSVCEEFISKGWNIVFFTLPGNLTYPDLEKNRKRYELIAYNAPKIVKNPLAFFSFFKNMLSCWMKLKEASKEGKPDAVIGFGGYPSFPAVLWAKFNHIPYFLQEQNAAYGMVTRLMKSKARKLFLSFPSKHKQPNEVVCGNPIRQQFQTALDDAKDAQPTAKKSKSKKTQNAIKIKNILLLGGSQGASDINSLYLKLMQQPTFQKVVFTVSSGEREFDAVLKAARKIDKIFPFIENMAEEMIQTDFIIARAGAGLVFEILAVRKPALFLPYPYATDDHQKMNAAMLADKNLCAVIDLRPFDANAAVKTIEQLLTSEKITEYQTNMLQHDITLNGAEIIYEEISGLVY